MHALFWVRLGFVALCFGACSWLVWRRERVIKAVTDYFFEPSGAENLALMRIVVFGFVLAHALATPAAWYATLPSAFQTLPRGWEWFDDPLPFLLPHTAWFARILIAAAFLSVIGVFTRIATIVAALFAVFVFAIPQFYFKIEHGMHVQILCTLVLAAGPTGDALSVDAWRRKRRGGPAPGRSVAYTIPVRFCWLLVGTMYLYPGLWKLWDAGDLWLNGSALKAHMLGKLTESPNFFPVIRLDRYRAVTAILGIATLVFEIGFIFAMFNRTTRIIAGFTASAFHIGVAITMNIFFNFWWPLVVLIDFPHVLTARPVKRLVAGVAPLNRWVEKLAGAPLEAASPTPTLSATASILVGCLLLFAQGVAGLAPINSFPVGCYPKFASRDISVPPGSYLEFVLKKADGSEQKLSSAFEPIESTAGTWTVFHQVLKAKRDKRAVRRFNDLIARVVRENNPNVDMKGATLLVYRFDFPVEPSERKPPGETDRTLLSEVEL